MTNTLPSPILPVLAVREIASTTAAAMSDGTAISSFTFGSSFTSYSAPR